MFFPTIKSAWLTPIVAVMENPSLLEEPDCPYDQDTKEFFHRVLSTTPSTIPSDISIYDGEEDRVAVLEREVAQLAYSFRTHGDKLKDEGDRTQYYKSFATVMEKLVTMQERLVNMRQMLEFQQTLTQFLDEVCSPEQISEFRRRLDVNS